VIGKRLFWISIIIVELAVVYFLWRPYRNHFVKPSRRIAVAHPAVRRPEVPTSPVIPPPSKPLAAVRSTVPTHRMRRLIVNTALKTPEPVPPKPAAESPLTSFESFWCNISRMESNCDCKENANQSSSLLTP